MAARKRPLELPDALKTVAALAAVFVLLAELTLDVEAHIVLYTAVVVAGVALVGGYAVWVLENAWRSVVVSPSVPTRRDAFIRWAVAERLDLFLLTVCLAGLAFEVRAAPIGVVLRLGFAGVRRLLRWSFAAGDGGPRMTSRLRPAQALALSFLGLITSCAALLVLPAATVDGLGASLTDAAFTGASATSVTGLIVQDTSTYWSTFGLVVILVTCQIGAIGIMALASAFAVLVGGRLPGFDRQGLTEAGFGDVVDVATLDGVKRLTISITGLTLGIEGIGALVLYGLWATGVLELRPEYDGWGGALWWSVFHSVSAFCHAGFSLEPNSLVAWQSNGIVNLVFIVLITLGAFGFPVLADLLPRRRGAKKARGFHQRWLSLHMQTRVVLIMTAVLNLGGMVAFLFFEYDRSLAGLDVPTKAMAALFQSVTTRSAGFNTVDIGAISVPAVFVCLVLMFIGSAPGSTGGGVRVTTAAVVVMAVRSMLRGREDVEVQGRRLPKSIVYRSISIILIAGVLCAVAMVLVTSSQDHIVKAPLGTAKLMFESVSAFGTVGLSMGVTSDLDNVGKWIMTLLMYVGRVGPLTLALAIGERVGARGYRYPEGRMAVG